MADTKSPPKTTQIDEKKRLYFLEWFSNARFECSKESKLRYICRDPGLHKKVNDLLKGVYEQVKLFLCSIIMGKNVLETIEY